MERLVGLPVDVESTGGGILVLLKDSRRPGIYDSKDLVTGVGNTQ